MRSVLLLPQPEGVAVGKESFMCGDKIRIELPEALKVLAPAMETLGRGWLIPGPSQMTFSRQETLPEEGYELDVCPDGIHICYSGEAGAFYGLMTLRQLAMQVRMEAAVENNGAGADKENRANKNAGADKGALELPCVHITDAPGLGHRGYMLDISRGKVPTLETLEGFVDLLASFKYNQLQLYIEGFSFMYASFEKYCDEKSALTPEEIRALDSYCKERFIDLVPNQNGFGHMAPWLSKEEFRPLAEAPNGWKLGEMTLPPTTLDARNDDCIGLLEKMCGDLLPNFTSRYFNVDMDEPFDMGLGNNQEFCAEHGKDELYAIHAKKLHQLSARHGRTMMMWGDVAVKYPSLLKELPEDIIILDWGYEAEFPVERHAQLLKDNGRHFYLCPGTNAWSSYTGMTDNMLTCIRRAVRAAYEYGAGGVLLTDWGDGGHLQYQPVSYAPMVYAAALMWRNEDASEEMLARALDLFVFEDMAGVMGRACLEAGRYERLEEFALPCRSMASVVCNSGRTSKAQYIGSVERMILVNKLLCQPEVTAAFAGSYDDREAFDADKIADFLDGVKAQFKAAKPQCVDGELIVQEYENALELVQLLTRLRMLCMNEATAAGDVDVQAAENIMKNHKKLWMARNKESGLPEGMAILGKLRASLKGQA